MSLFTRFRYPHRRSQSNPIQSNPKVGKKVDFLKFIKSKCPVIVQFLPQQQALTTLIIIVPPGTKSTGPGPKDGEPGPDPKDPKNKKKGMG